MKTLNTRHTHPEALKAYVSHPSFTDALQGARSVLVQVFSGHCQTHKLQTLLGQLSQLVPQATIVGTTTGCAILGGQLCDDGIVLSFSFFEQATLSCAVLPFTKDSKINLARQLASELVDARTKGILLFLADPVSLRPDKILTQLDTECPNIPVFGGIAGSSGDNDVAKIFTATGVLEQGMVAVAFRGDELRLHTDYSFNWQPVGKSFKVTKCAGNLVQKIDRKPAKQVFLKYLGAEAAESSQTLPEFPLMFTQQGVDVARAVQSLNADNSISLAAAVSVGDVFRFSYPNIADIYNKAVQTVERTAAQPAEAIFVYSCSTRLSYLGDEIQREIFPLEGIAPTSGFFTHGEFFHSQGRNLLLNETMTLVVFSESPNINLKKETATRATTTTELPQRANQRQPAILRALTHLANTVAKDLEHSNATLKDVNDELNVLLDNMIEKSLELKRKNADITASITYAKRIQNALLTSRETIADLFGKHFILYKPRDIVSGDFYWAANNGNLSFIAAADCTGHGVPGAFLSMLGITFLNEIVQKFEVISSAQVLEQLRLMVKNAFHRSAQGEQTKDGMDIALCIINRHTNTLQFSGANNPLYLLRNGELLTIKATRNPIGYYLKERHFEMEEMALLPGDRLYIFSDGYVDQFGPQGKFKSKRFKELLQTIHTKPMAMQQELLHDALVQWQDNTEQLDDILVIGIEHE